MTLESVRALFGINRTKSTGVLPRKDEHTVGVDMPYRTDRLTWEDWEKLIQKKRLEIEGNPKYKKELEAQMVREEKRREGLYDVKGIGNGLVPFDDHDRQVWWDPQRKAIYIPPEYRKDGAAWKTDVEHNSVLAMFYFTQEKEKRALKELRSNRWR